MFCYKCGKEIPDDALFCPKCGAKRKDVTSAESKPAENKPAETKPIEAKQAPKDEKAAVKDTAVSVAAPSKSFSTKVIIIVLIGVAALAGGIAAGYYINKLYHGAENETVQTDGQDTEAKATETADGGNDITDSDTVDTNDTADASTENDEAASGSDAESETGSETPAEEEKPVEEEKSPFSNLRAGDHVSFGNYEQDGDTQNGKEPVEWIVLDANEDGALLISKYVLACRPYNNDYKNVTWETCSLRKWLNGDFYDSAFSETEKNFIKPSALLNDNNQLWQTKGGNNTDDNVFCLSVSEIQKYYKFSNWYGKDQMGYCQDLLAEYTSYAMEERSGALWTYTFSKSFRDEAKSWDHGKGLAYTDNVIGRSVSAWWLRSPGENNYEACYVGGHGDAGASIDREVNNDDFGVRPAMWVRTK